MCEEESAHHARLLETYKPEYGDHIPLVRRQDVKGFVKRKPIWLDGILQPKRVLGAAMTMEAETRRFYREASNAITSADIQKILIPFDDAKEDHPEALVEYTQKNKK